jgi:hypothetical protein
MDRRKTMTKQVIIDALTKSGLTAEDAEKTYNATVPKTDAELMREVEMLKAERDKYKEYTKQAIEVANRANSLKEAQDAAEKDNLVLEIGVATNNRMGKDQLKGKSLSELRLIKTTLDVSLEDTFASVATIQAAKDQAHAPLLTAGKWSADEGKWVGGL